MHVQFIAKSEGLVGRPDPVLWSLLGDIFSDIAVLTGLKLSYGNQIEPIRAIGEDEWILLTVRVLYPSSK